MAHRAALAALNLAYGKDIAYSGSIFAKASILGNTVTCTFNQVAAGLMVGQRDVPPKKPLVPTVEVPDGTLNGFELAGSDDHFFPATAQITGNATLDVSSPSVDAPVSVRYAWAGAPTCNLYNKIENDSGQIIDGLPASPFRFVGEQ